MEVVHPFNASHPPRRRRLWLLGLVALFVALALAAWFGQDQPARKAQMRAPILDNGVPYVAPVSDPAALRPVTAAQAEELNAALPLTADPSPAGASFSLPARDDVSWTRAVDCMTAAIYYEAANEPTEGQYAVAQVILNRARDPAYPHSVCGVIFQGAERSTGCQFSFTCDGSLARIPSRQGWLRARGAAISALSGYVYSPVGMATHYHADYVAPVWAPLLAKVKVIGAHIFYRWKGARGLPAAFTARYAGVEPNVSGDASLAMALMHSGEGMDPTLDLRSPAPDRAILAIDGSTLRNARETDPGVPNPAIRPLVDIADLRHVPPADVPAQPSAGRWVIGIDGKASGQASASPP